MNIVYSSSDSYAELCGISLVSLFENNKEVEKIKVYIINNGIKENNINKLLKVAEKYEREMLFVNSIDIEKITNTNITITTKSRSIT